MAFASKTDWVGLESTVGSATIKLRSNGENATNQVLPIHGSNGAYIGDEIFGSIKTPTCEYAICGASTVTGLLLGNAYSNASGSTPYALNHIHITTGAGVEPVVTADAVQIEPSVSRAYCVFELDDIDLSPARHANTFNAFTYSETETYYGTESGTATALTTLQNCDFDATIGLNPTTINGKPVGSDGVEGVENVTATFWTNSNTSAPSVTLESDWHWTSPLTCTGPDSGMYQWVGTATKYLKASEPSNS